MFRFYGTLYVLEGDVVEITGTIFLFLEKGIALFFDEEPRIRILLGPIIAGVNGGSFFATGEGWGFISPLPE